MDAVEILAHVRRLGGTLTVENGRLRAVLPQGLLTPDLNARIAENKAELVSILASERANGGTDKLGIAPVSRPERLPLSFAQERLWFIEQMRTGETVYNIAQGIRFLGPLDTDVFRQVLTEISRRHEVLRSRFVADETGVPYCEISDPAPFALVFDDASAQDNATRERWIHELATDEMVRPFDIARGPVVRARLIRCAPQEHVFLFTVPHIIFDGWSSGILWREFTTLYEAFVKGMPSPLKDPPLQFWEFATWQRRYFTDERLAAGLDYWTNHLRGAPALMELPTDRPRPAVEGVNGARVTRTLSPRLTQALRDLARRQRATLFTVLLAGFKALLHRYTSQGDILVGVPFAGRSRVETEQTIGLFVNTLVLRTDLTGDPSFLALLERVRIVSLEAFSHGEVPFERLVRILRPRRELAFHPVYQVMFTLEYAPAFNAPETGLEARYLSGRTTAAQVDLMLNAAESADTLVLTSIYKTDLFDEESMASMLHQLETLMESAVADPKRPLSRLPLLDVKSRDNILTHWSGGSKSFPVEKCLHERFEVQADRAPEAIAATCDGEHLTYRALDERANRLARILRERGVGPDVLVGLCFERGLDMLVGVLGILKAGGAYVPLDLANPAERIAIILEDSQVPVLVTDSSQLAKLPPHSASVVCLDRDRELLEAASASRLGRVAGPEHLAYVIYTSGSTGKPKGVQIEHRQAVRLFDATHELYKFDSSDVWSLFHSIAFDVSVYEIWGALFYGGRIVVVPYLTSRTPERFHELLVRERVTVLSQTPSAFRALIPADQRAGVDSGLSLKWIIFAGEALDLQSLAPWFEKHGDIKPRLVNMYGITETTVHVTWREIKHRDLTEAPGSVVGPPMPDLRIYVLDAQRQPVPIGVPGEIYVGGPGVARGYLRRPELTAERFIPNPFVKEPEARLYKSGDLARFTHSGDLLYLGRNDDQVKIRGFRIELGEIRAALDKSPLLTASAVVIQKDPAGAPRIVAYAVPAPGANPTLTELRAHLKSQLPEYMIPAAIVFLPALPLTPNGKLDRRALPSPEPDREAEPEEDARPRTPTEEILAGIWRGLLHVKQVRLQSNFFELGGHSLVATQVTSRVRDLFGVELPLVALFEEPTLSGLAARIEALQRGGARADERALTAAPAGTPGVLSFGQERLWFLEQLQDETAAFNIPMAGRFKGPLDVAALEKSLTEIVRRHEVLRSTYPRNADGNPRCVVAEPAPFDLPVTDLTSVEPAAREEKLREAVAREVHAPFHIDRGPLVRACLVRLAPTEHVFILTIHHMVSDGWSMGILWREIVALYTAFAEGKPSPLTELPIQYADAARWQRSWLDDERLGKQLDYWKNRLRGIPPLLELPTDRPRPSVERFNGATAVRRVGPGLTRSLRELARRHDATLFMVLLAGFKALLHRYTSQDDIVVGVPIAGRTRAEMESLIGLFINSLVLRTDLTGDPTFAELLTRVRTTSLGAFANQELPFERLVQALRPARDQSHHAVFQVLFSLQNAPRANAPIPGMQLEALSTEGLTSQFDLTLVATEFGDELSLGATYKTDLFDEETIVATLARFETLLEGAVADPKQPISRLPLLDAPSTDRLLAEWNAESREFPVAECLHERFEARAAETPDAVAVSHQGDRLTYRELDTRANRLARVLRDAGVGPDVLVGLCFERGLDLIVGMLGILKAGGAYVPLDLSNPPERIAFILEDSQVPVLVTESALLDRVPVHSARVVCLDKDRELLGRASADRLPRAAGPGHLAYVIYTSGSTGKPKGVQIEHRQALRLFDATHGLYKFGPGDVWTLFHSSAFDFSVWEIWGALLYGGRLVVVPYLTSRSPEEFLKLLTRERVTVLNQTPSAFRALVAADRRAPAEDGLALKWVIFGGEALDLQSLAPWFERHGDSKPTLVNMYGITETTVHVTWRVLREQDLTSAPGSVIGEPIPDLRLYVLDAHRRPAPTGVPGELYVGGAGLARGYLRRPELTAERFLPNPFVPEPGERMYKSGDTARFTHRGDLLYLGRNDEQVKIRGFRIELGEIRAALDKSPLLTASAVVFQKDSGGAPRIVAYAVPAPGAKPTVTELRAHLKSQLPDYMVPAAIVFLPALPLTPNGKLDKQALPSPELDREAESEEDARSLTPTEEILAGIWRGLLNVKQVRLHSNFFELGGHSLVATQVTSRVRDACGVELPLVALFEEPTLAGLAARIEALQRGGVRADEQPLTAAPAGTPGVLSFGQERLWFLEQLQEETAAFNIPIAGRFKGDLDVVALRNSLTEIVRRHEVLRSAYPRDADGNPRCVVAEPAPFDVPETDLTGVEPEAREARLRESVERETRAPFHIDRERLVRARLVKLAPKEHVFILTIHHMVSDGWSMGILWRELVSLYTAFAEGKPSPLTELPIQYTDAARWQRSWLTDERLEKQAEYWKNQLRGIPPLLELPTDRPRPSVERFHGANVVRRVDADLTRSLRELARRHDATLFMVLLAGFKALLHRYASQDDIVVGVPIAGRTRAEMENLLGLFINSLVLRTDLTGDPTFEELLTRVRTTSLGAFANQEMPFERLVQVLRPPRDLSHHPVFQVLFSLQNAPRANAPVPGMQLESFPTEGMTSQFDLALFAAELGEELSFSATYKTDLFDAPTIHGILEQLETLLRGAAADASVRVSRLPLLTGNARRQVIDGWGAAEASAPAAATLHGLVRHQIEKTPEAIAVEFEGNRLTYDALGRQTAAIAARLRALGVGRGSRVGIYLERGLTIPAALLGVLESGAAYVPLDPFHPLDRTKFILGDAGLDVLLTQDAFAPRFEGLGVRLWAIDKEPPAPVADSNAAPEVVSPGDLAYVIYTSGSTGRPKGVEITHASVVNFLTSMQRAPGLSSGDVFLSVTTLSFDIAVLEIFGPLSVGAKSVLVPAEVAANGLRLDAKLSETRATVCQATPATWRLLLEARWIGDRRLKILCGGEAWTRPLADELLPRCGSLWNMYGPTETTVWSAIQQVKPGSGPVAIGEPITKTRLYILDEHGEPLPAGVPGELCIGGAGVARGYWNRPELTAQRFVPDPFVKNPDARLYKTGDRVRRRRDGTIEFLGRFDFQVKVQGFRIELGEIESVLTSVPGVREAVCTAHDVGPGDRRLVAYVVADPAERPGEEALRAALRVKLPDFMVPGIYQFLDALPRTPNGKVDRAALPKPERSAARVDKEDVKPSTAWEKRIAAVWQDLLAIDGVNIVDNFFDLGGHSLLAMRAVARIEKETGVKVSPSDLIVQTLGQVAAACEQATAAPAAEPETPQGPAPKRGWIRKLLGG